MVPPHTLPGSYGLLPEMEKPALPEVFHIDDLLNFSCEDIGGSVVGGELQVSGAMNESSVNGGETSISSSVEVESDLVGPALRDIEVKTDLCVPVSLKIWCSCAHLNASHCVSGMRTTIRQISG